MILEALNSKISGICSAYPLLGDIESNTPFAVYSANQTVIRDKSGIVGYEYLVTISVVDEDLSDTITVGSGIKVSIDTLAGTTAQDTVFDMVHFNGENQRFDENANAYINDIEYRILTQNE